MSYKIYIAGPMQKIENYNFSEFFRAEKKLKKYGYNVINPARLSLKLSKKLKKDLSEIPRNLFILQDLKELLKCDAIYMLKGWLDSEGSQLEYEIAKQIGINIFYE